MTGRGTRTLLLAGALLLAPALHAEPYYSGDPADPSLRQVAWLAADGRNFSALSELLLIQRAADSEGAHATPALDWQLADAYLDFGLADKAATIYDRLAHDGADRSRLAKARLRLAEFYYERGDYDKAGAQLGSDGKAWPDDLVAQWQDLASRVLLRQGRYADAEALLDSTRNVDRQMPYTRYNLAIAKLHTGKLAEGRDILEHLGHLGARSDDDLALRDRANLTLGWNFLQNQLGASAVPVFDRVRSQGPFSNRALLGLGWAELTTRGKLQRHSQLYVEERDRTFDSLSTLGVLIRPGFLDRDAFSRAGLRTFRMGKVSSDEQTALRRALAAWSELLRRNPMDPAVQEGWLAIPYSLDKLGAHAEALRYYETAVKNLDDSRKRLEQATAAVRQQRMVDTILRRDIDQQSGWNWKLTDLPYAPETYYLQDLIAGHPFQEALKNYRDLHLMAQVLDDWQQRLAALENSYRNADRAPVDAGILFRRVSDNWSAPWVAPVIDLRAENSLAAPGSYSAAAPRPDRPTIDLQLSEPRSFGGEWERIQALKARLAGLQPLVADALKRQAAVLQDMSIKELDGQKQQIDKYLIEARFALARLYDKQIKGEINEK